MTEPQRRMYFFQIKCRPTSDSEHHPEIAWANADICVMSSSPDVARTLALAHLVGYGWEATSIEFVREIPLEPYPEWDTLITSVHRLALEKGIGSSFVAVRRNEGKPDDPAELRPLGRPTLKDI